MNLSIRILMDNAAFENLNGTEVARLLRQMADKVDGTALDDDSNGNLRDINGNFVGEWEVEE